MDLSEAIMLLIASTTPEQIFGNDVNLWHKQYRKLCSIVHPDVHKREADKKRAEKAFKKLGEWESLAQQKEKRGSYGVKENNTSKSCVIVSKTDTYILGKKVSDGDLSDVYLATNSKKETVIVKICRDTVNNDLLRNEAEILKAMWTGRTKGLKAMAHIPKIKDSFSMPYNGSNELQVNVLEYYSGYYTLDQVHKAYPDGIEIKAMAWMWNRLLGALLMAHQSGYVHGAVLPQHFLINPENHNGILIDWCYAVPDGNPLKAINPDYKHWYPWEVFEKKTAPGTDLFMSAKNMIFLLGGKGFVPIQTPRKIDGILRLATFSSLIHRARNAYELHQDFSKVLLELYGAPHFTEFKMP